jgi:microcompartment protein CcmK/EutM
MFLAHVVGEVVATIKHAHLAATKLLLVQPSPWPAARSHPR